MKIIPSQQAGCFEEGAGDDREVLGAGHAGIIIEITRKVQYLPNKTGNIEENRCR